MNIGLGGLSPIRAGPWCWHVLPELKDCLLSADGLRLEEWLQTGCAQVVKHGPHRTVYRVDLPGTAFYLKHYRMPDLRSWLRQWLRPAKARMEFQSALAVAQLQVPTILPIALGEGWSGTGPRDSYLLTQSLDGAEPLCDFLLQRLQEFPEARRTRLRQRIAHELGRFVGHLHNVGIAHQDLHAANLLLRLEKDDQPRLFLIDLHDVRLRTPLDWPASRRNLALLNRWFILRVSRSDRFRFWKAYVTQRQCADQHALPQPAIQLARPIEEHTWISNVSFWSKRDSRCLGHNRYYQRLQKHGMVGHAVRDLDAAAMDELLHDPDQIFSRPGVQILKHSRSSTVAELDITVAGQLQTVIFKRFTVTSWKDPLSNLLRRSPPLRSWIQGNGLRFRCLPTPRPLAVFHRHKAGLDWEGYLVTEKIPDAEDLLQCLQRLAILSADESRAELCRRIEQVAHLVRELHQRHLSHRDLKAGNILLNPQGVWFIDLVGVQPHKRLPQARIMQNLARLHASFVNHPQIHRTDKLRFLRTYLQWGLKGATGWKAWWDAIEQATLAKIRKNQRSGRPLA